MTISMTQIQKQHKVTNRTIKFLNQINQRIVKKKINKLIQK